MAPKDRWLLPEGIEETLPLEARRLEAMRRVILDLFDRWGYALVMPPLIEYLESLLTGVGGDMDLQTFKVTDQLTGRLMGIRPDMTPQAARIDAHYLKRSHAVRLCYLGPVLRTRPNELAGSREPLQLGAELFGHSGPASDAEVISLMAATLTLAGIERPHIDLAHVGVFGGLAAAAGLDAERKGELLDALERKARSEVETLLAGWSVATDDRRRLLALLELNGDVDVLARARALYAPIAPVLAAIENLEAVAQQVHRLAHGLELHFDLAELGGYHYYTGTMFAAFVPGQGQAIAKGGRYDGIGRAFGRDRAATGFSADLRKLLKIGRVPDISVTGILAPATDDAALIAEIARLRAAGERVVQQLPGDTGTGSDHGCERRLAPKNGQWRIEPIKS
ncbi:MAG: ATP phosphoribosyltransferase regulatory subunit [Gammaproteobacteria bacterium]|nr:ATP phosphoribosyltransferase regulatory subunit [Gammaproteobacteria bacterium]